MDVEGKGRVKGREGEGKVMGISCIAALLT